jgi:hypothetical protein
MGITHSWNGTVLVITSDSGTSSADLKGDMGIRGPQGNPGVITGTVITINGKQGEVELTAEDVGALPVGDIANYYTKEEINEAITNYYTKSEIDTAITNYYTKEELDTSTEQLVRTVYSAIPTKVSVLENDAGFLNAAEVAAIVQEELGVIENGTY